MKVRRTSSVSLVMYFTNMAMEIASINTFSMPIVALIVIVL